MRRRCPKSLWIVEGARHQDFLSFDPRGYDANVVEFLLEALAVPRLWTLGIRRTELLVNLTGRAWN